MRNWGVSRGARAREGGGAGRGQLACIEPIIQSFALQLVFERRTAWVNCSILEFPMHPNG